METKHLFNFVLQLSYGDIAMFMVQSILTNKETLASGGLGDHQADIIKALAQHPKLTKLHKEVATHPRIAEYLAKRPDYPF